MSAEGTPTQADAQYGETGAQHHESGLVRIVHGLGHAVAEGASVLLTPYSHGAERSTGLDATSADRRHVPGQFTGHSLPLPESWSSNRRT